MAESLRSPDLSEGRSFPGKELAHLPVHAEASSLASRGKVRPSAEDASALLPPLAIRQAMLSQRLHFALQNAASKSAQSMEALRLAVSEFTVALRDQGTMPEAVLIELKAAINAHALSATSLTSRWSDPELHESMSSWCIEEYFKEVLPEAIPLKMGPSQQRAIQVAERPATFWRAWLHAVLARL